MQKDNLSYVLVYAAAAAAVVICSFLDIPFADGENFISVFNKITFTTPVLFIIAAFLSLKIAETRMVLVSLVFLMLSLSPPFFGWIRQAEGPGAVIAAAELLSAAEAGGCTPGMLPLCLPFFMVPLLFIPERAGSLTLLPFRIAAAVLPFIIVLLPFIPLSEAFERYYTGSYLLPWPVIITAALPGALSALYRNRRNAAFSAVLSFMLIFVLLPVMLNLNDFYTDLCGLLAGVILLHSLYRVYWGNSYIDELTGLFNRRALDERLGRLGKGYSLSMVDVDHFKNFNDTYGHDEGDNVLRLVASILRDHFGKTAFRYGGEEFCVVFRNTAVEDAAEMMNHARSEIASRGFSIRSSGGKRKKSGRKKGRNQVKKVRLTVSAGLSVQAGPFRDAETVLRNADKALYRAKESGRNRVAIIRPK